MRGGKERGGEGGKGEDMNYRFERDKGKSRRTSVDRPPSVSLLPLFTHQQDYGGPISKWDEGRNKLIAHCSDTVECNAVVVQ